MKCIVHKRDTLVVGGTVQAFTYAYLHSLPVVYLKSKIPYAFDFFPLGYDLDSKFYIEPTRTFMRTPAEELEIYGNKKEDLFRKCGFIISLAGNAPVTGMATSVMVEDKVIKIVVSNTKLVEIEYDKLIIFDDEDIVGLPVGEEQKGTRMVVDWLDVKSGSKHGIDTINTDDDFVRKVYFYLSSRITNNAGIKRCEYTKVLKDAVAISYLTLDEINDIDYSEIYVRFKVKEMMKNAGIMGGRRGILPSGNWRYNQIRLESAYREVERKMNLRENDDRIEYNYQTIEELLETNKDKCLDLFNYGHMVNWCLSRKKTKFSRK